MHKRHLLAMGMSVKRVNALTPLEAKKLYEAKQRGFNRPTRQPKAERLVSRETSAAIREQRAFQKSLRKPRKARFDKVSQMRGDKYGWTYTQQHGSREYRVVGEPCLTCGKDHHYRGKHHE